MLKIYFLFCFAAAFELQVLLVLSENSPSSILKICQSTIKTGLFIVYCLQFSAINEGQVKSSALLLDATWTISKGAVLRSLSEQYQISYLNLGYTEPISVEKDFNLLPSPKQIGLSLSSLSGYLNFTEIIVFSSEDDFSIKASKEMITLHHSIPPKLIVIGDELRIGQIKSMIAKSIKPTNFRVFFVVGKEEVARNILQSLAETKLLSTGTAVVLYGEANIDLATTGLIGVVPYGLEGVSGSVSFYLRSISNLLNYTSNNLIGFYDQGKINQVLLTYLKFLKNSPLSVVNTQPAQQYIGCINQGTVNISNLTYLGGASFFVYNYRIPIRFGYAGGQNNGPGVPATTFNPNQMLGAVFATQIANNDSSLIPNFNFTPVYTDCGVNTGNLSYISSCLNQTKDLGVGFLSTAWFPSSIPYMQYFNPKPVVGTDTTDQLSNKTLYSNFIRATAPATYNVVVLMTIIKIYEFKQVALMCTNITKFMDMCNKFVKLAQANNIKILNNQSLWVINNFYTRDRFAQDRAKFEAVVNSGARYFVALIPSVDLYYIGEALYDLGVRAGDIQILFPSKTGANICIATDPAVYCTKRQEIMASTIGVYNAEWSGDYGKKMNSLIIPFYGTYTSFQCTAFDQSMLMVRAIANLVLMGYDYEDPALLNNYMRRMRFTGCSGTVSLSQDTNDRSNQPTFVANLLFSNGSFNEVYSALYDPSSQNPYYIISPILWTSGSTTPPSDYRFSLNCPFDETKAKTSTAGYQALYIICFLFAGYVVGICAFFAKLEPGEKFEMIESKKIMTGQDMVIFGIISVEVFQLFSLGVSPTDSSSLVKTVSDITGINFRNLVYLKGSSYWNLFVIVVILCWIFQVLSILTLFRKKRIIFFRSAVFGCLDLLGEYVMPLYGELAFIPIVSVILDIYTCTMCVEDGVTNSYNSHDCNVYCWTGSHLSLAVIGIVTLAFFFPWFLFLRPTWQGYQKTLNIKQRYFNIYFKSVFQMFAVVFSKTISHSSESTFGFVFTFYILAYLVSLRFFSGYNYGIANLWLGVSLGLVSYTELLYSISIVSTFDGKYIAVAMFLGWIALGIAGVFVQSKYFVVFLYFAPSKDITEILEEAFGNRRSKYIDENNSHNDL